MAERSGLSVSITTKSNQVLQDLDLIKRIAEKSSISVNLSITTMRHAPGPAPRAPRPAPGSAHGDGEKAARSRDRRRRAGHAGNSRNHRRGGRSRDASASGERSGCAMDRRPRPVPDARRPKSNSCPSSKPSSRAWPANTTNGTGATTARPRATQTKSLTALPRYAKSTASIRARNCRWARQAAPRK